MLELEADDTVFLGDTHMNAPWTEGAIRHAADDLGTTSIVQLGDFGFTFDMEFCRRIQDVLLATGSALYFVRGNHDSTEVLRGLDKDGSLAVGDDPFEAPRPLLDRKDCRIFYLPDAMRFRIGDEAALVMGGAGSIDRHMRTPGQEWWDDERVEARSALAATLAGPADILLSHDVPAGVGFPLNPRFGHYFETRDPGVLAWCDQSAMRLDSVVASVQPRLIVHGHHHRRLDLVRYGHVRDALSVGLSRDERPYDDAMIPYPEIRAER